MARLECDADFAIGLEPSDARTMPSPRIDDDEAAADVDVDALGGTMRTSP